MGTARLTFPAVRLHADGLLAFQDHALHRCVGDNGQIFRCRCQQVSCRGANTLVSRVNQHGHANWVAGVVVWVQGKSSLLKGIKQWREVSFPLRGEPDMEGAGAAVVGGLGGSVFLVDTRRDVTVEGLQALKPGLDVLPPVVVVTHNPRPLLIVVSGADAVDAKVDGTGSANAFSARVVDLAVVEILLGAGLVAKVHGFVLEGQPPLPVDAEVAVVILASGLEEEHFGTLWSACKAGGNNTTSRSTYIESASIHGSTGTAVY